MAAILMMVLAPIQRVTALILAGLGIQDVATQQVLPITGPFAMVQQVHRKQGLMMTQLVAETMPTQNPRQAWRVRFQP